MTDTPQVLLAHHLKTLKLPTFGCVEYDKIARQCAAEGVDHVRYLLRLAELELIDRERSNGRAADPTSEVPDAQEPGQLRLQGDRARGNKDAGPGSWRRSRIHRSPRPRSIAS